MDDDYDPRVDLVMWELELYRDRYASRNRLPSDSDPRDEEATGED